MDANEMHLWMLVRGSRPVAWSLPGLPLTRSEMRCDERGEILDWPRVETLFAGDWSLPALTILRRLRLAGPRGIHWSLALGGGRVQWVEWRGTGGGFGPLAGHRTFYARPERALKRWNFPTPHFCCPSCRRVGTSRKAIEDGASTGHWF